MRAIHYVISAIAVSFAVSAQAGTTAVEPPVNPPTSVTPIPVDTQAIVTVVAPLAAVSTQAQAALSELRAAPSGSPAALSAVNALAGAIASALPPGNTTISGFSPAQATQAIGLLNTLIATLQRSNAATGGLEALRALIQDQAAG